MPRTLRRAVPALFATLAVLALLSTSAGLPLVSVPQEDGLLLAGTVVTMDDAGTVLEDGRVLVRGERIEAVWSGPMPPAGVDVAGARVVDLGPEALVFPGLVNLHGHPAYDVVPLWLAPSSHAQPAKGRPTGEEPYANRYQWNDPREGAPEYRRIVANPRAALVFGLEKGPEMVKWAEAMSLLGGQTTLEGDGVRYAETDFSLARNVDYGAFCRHGQPCEDRVQSRVNDVEDMRLEDCEMDVLAQTAQNCPSMSILAGMALGETDAWLVHLAEGVRDARRRPGDNESARAEFAHLASLGLLTEQTVVIHGVALEAPDFLAMRAAPSARLDRVGDGLGARLVWSPLSNLLLYGETAHVHEALRAGVLVSLGTDWTPGGSRNLLGELKVADVALRDPRVLGGERFLVPGHVATPDEERALDRTLVEMATRNPARTVRAFDRIGSVEAGKLADLLVIRRPAASPTGGMPDSPYRSLLDATERDVRLVLVGGAPLAGDVDLMQALKPGDFEVVPSARGGFSKALDLTDPSVPRGAQTLAEVEAALRVSMAALGGDDPPAGGGPADDANTYRHLKENLDRGVHATKSDAEFLGDLKRRYGTVDGRLNLEAVELNPLLVEDDALLFVALDVALDGDGLVDVHPAPYGRYLANPNHALAPGNPFAAAAFESRWYGAAAG